MRFARFVLNRRNVQSQLLRNPQLLDEVQYQVVGIALGHPSITVYRNNDGDRGNVVATAPMSVEQAYGVLSKILAGVKL